MASQGQRLRPGSKASKDKSFRERLLQIDASLGTHDVESLKFLCSDLLPRKKLELLRSASDLFELLLSEQLLSEDDPFLLAELLHSIRQNMLLGLLGYTTEQVHSLLPTCARVSKFRKLLYELSEALDSEELKDTIFLLREHLPKTQLTPLAVLACLEKQTLIEEDDLSLLETVLRQVSPCLLRKIEVHRSETAAERGLGPADREVDSLPGGRGEVLSRRDVEQLSQALPETAVYSMGRSNRGHCVIINNHHFIGLDDRTGTHKDAESLEQVFQWLGFSVRMHNDVTKERLEKILQEEKSSPGHADGDCFVFCVLSHGEFGAVYCSDSTLVPLREITAQFTAQQCPALACKPKLFFVQACQGKSTHPPVAVVADARNPDAGSPPLECSIPDEADFLLGLATVPGYVSFRHQVKGSWYIQSLCNHLKNLVPRREDILSILTKVNEDVSQQADRQGLKKQMPQPAFTLRKKLVFPVPRGTFSS